ncbi:uracil-DNA glycosylase [Siculibacillus lacustris]|uniref:Type-5 uracil-DNA glycosylase n=1 Tax=Siculibacillus lacustris TaxID=1549641 RepID=A0A4V2KU27_9HYPH|nr:uracil-DNA glycosylase [Siculibacillus lacustris]TBW39751.1 uracil-DNA glycosylase [Siculibacillus lacustris]
MPHPASAVPLDPGHDCPLCPRLVAFREDWRRREPEWFNGPVPSFPSAAPRLLVVGLAPGVRGANRTGRPFTGDYAGELLYETLIDYGFAQGTFRADPQDGLTLTGALITNAVRCVPPENKPTPAEIQTCRPFLIATLAAHPGLTDVLALGRIAHETFLRTVGEKLAARPFAHGAIHGLANGLRLHDSYHCSRYNTNTGRLTRAMFRSVFDGIAAAMGHPPRA